MTTVKDLEQRVKKLNSKELAEFRDWFLNYEWDAWDSQLEKDSKSGKLDELARQAREHHAAGRTRAL
jgi:hypothetical protein